MTLGSDPRRGTMRIYLGAAPGVGKTFAMLNEGRRRASRGTDVVVGFVETHGRARTAEQVADLEVVPRRTVEYRGTAFEEMDVDAVLARQPQVALVDELAHTNVPGSRNAKRWQDVNELLDAGIDVVSTVNIQHLESINDVVERITGIKQRETIPDECVRAAEQVELVDMTPEALRRRMAHGNIYAPEKIDAALGNYFRLGNLAALRELALLWVADKVDVALEEYRERHGITEPWETRERVVVAVSGAPGTDDLIRRAARITQRAHGELFGVHVRNEEGLADPAGGPAGSLLEAHRHLLEEMGGEYHETAGADISAALIDFARSENATQVVLGASRRSRWQELTSGSVINRVVRLSGPIDVHVVSELQPKPAGAEGGGAHRQRWWSRSGRPSLLPPRRRAFGLATALAGVPLLTLLLAQLRDEVGLPTVLLLFLGLVVLAGALGGPLPAFVAAGGGFTVANWFFTPPYYELTVAEAENVVALVVFLAVGATTSSFVMSAARRAAEAAHARVGAETLARLAATTAEEDPFPGLMSHLVTAFGLDGAAVLRRSVGTSHPGRTGGTLPGHSGVRGPEPWSIEASAGQDPPPNPEASDQVFELAPGMVLGLRGRRVAAADRFVVKAFATQLANVVERRRLRAEAGQAVMLAEANELRTALLQAVSHDLRTPLASIKAASSSLCQDDVAWTPEDVRTFAGTIDGEVDRLTTLVTNLLDMSRLQAGVLRPALRAVDLEEVIPAALTGLGARAGAVDVESEGEHLPTVLADPALLERALANVIDNALTHSPPGRPVRIEVGAFSGRVDIRVIDQGPGIDRAERERVFRAFQRAGDTDSGTGVGLGLAVARGFVQAMEGTMEIEDTPGGGATLVVTLVSAQP